MNIPQCKKLLVKLLQISKELNKHCGIKIDYQLFPSGMSVIPFVPPKPLKPSASGMIPFAPPKPLKPSAAGMIPFVPPKPLKPSAAGMIPFVPPKPSSGSKLKYNVSKPVKKKRKTAVKRRKKLVRPKLYLRIIETKEIIKKR